LTLYYDTRTSVGVQVGERFVKGHAFAGLARLQPRSIRQSLAV
jgi:hypothetical protein